jgi:hypothetical protein
VGRTAIAVVGEWLQSLVMKLGFWRRAAPAGPPGRDEVQAILRDLRSDKVKLDKYESTFNTNPPTGIGGAWGDGSGAFPL